MTDSIETRLTRVEEELKFQDRLLWGLYAVLGGFITYVIFH